MPKFICKECNKVFNNIRGLNRHISIIHGSKTYYDKWLKKENEGICKNCGEETIYYKLSSGYKDTCSKKCGDKYAHQKSMETIQLKYGVNNVQQNELIKNKTAKTNLERYGNSCPMQNIDINKSIKNIMKEKYGSECSLSNKDIYDKSNKTKLKKYGNANYNNREKAKFTCIKKYGCENPSQYKEFQDKKIKNSIHDYKSVKYQGTYELDFLEKYYSKFTDIKRASSIKYIYNKKNRIYHPDFYIPSLNLIVEIKNSYLYKRDKDIILEKEKATISNGFNYIIIIDKDYKEFELFTLASNL